VQLNAVPAVAFAGHVTVTTRGCAATVTLDVLEALTELLSVTVKVSVLVPLVGSVLEIVPVPVYGAVPPVADTVQLKALPAVTPDVGQVAVTTRGWAATLTVAEADAVTPLASVTLNVSVLLPFEASVLLKVPAPVYGPVSPEADTVQLNALPAVTPDVGHETVTTSAVP